ncbi:hypothetical protein HZU40_02970 [Mycolicibacterium fluoranthenivorans]|uniref:PaaI family thioesterase n=1 Tax=Mycolicibacterium fluoranthenivorans TaxID=258505 RepID=A0A7G8PG75_9MYCO|nr:acyl-CoA thioesterase domain-containing protein [Mycolicibacterium fluoranthenivorans]QNJ93341.1 hypothetical protein HZU40_02970 [Mycolicibacterium fluoranthenivorans]
MSIAELDEAGAYDIDVPDGVRLRFGMRTTDYHEKRGVLTMHMPLGDTRSPLTGEYTVGAALVLADTIGSAAAFGLRGRGWPVTTELVLQVDPAFTGGSPTDEVAASCELVASSASRARSRYELLLDGRAFASGSATMAFVAGAGVTNARPAESLSDPRAARLAELLAVEPVPEADRAELRQRVDPMLLNATGHVHGGVAASGLALVADAAVNAGAANDRCFRLATITVNYIRPFACEPDGGYRAAVVRGGTSMAIADAVATGANGKDGVLARATFYR